MVVAHAVIGSALVVGVVPFLILGLIVVAIVILVSRSSQRRHRTASPHEVPVWWDQRVPETTTGDVASS